MRPVVFIVFADSGVATMSALGRTAAAFGRATVRRASSAAAPASTEAAAARPAARMPEGVDPAAFHPKAHAVSDMWRWRLVTGVASVPVFGYFCLQVRCVFALVWPARPVLCYFPAAEAFLMHVLCFRERILGDVRDTKLSSGGCWVALVGQSGDAGWR